MIRLIALTAALALASPTYAQDEPQSTELVPALQQCIEAVNDTRAADDGSAELPTFKECIGVGTNTCQEEPDGASTLGMSSCNQQEQAFWDDMLNYAYDSLKETLPSNVFASLKAAQQAWIPWRDARCNFVYENSKEGTISQVVTSYCLLETTAQRAIDLLDVMDSAAG